MAIGNKELFRRLCRARELLTEVCEQPLSVAEIAHATDFSPYHFIRQFEAVFGVTPHQFRIEARVRATKLQLALGKRSVTEICMEVGMSSLGSFSDLFAERVGERPSEYRRRARLHLPARGRAMIAVPGIVVAEMFPGCLSLMGRLPAGAFRNFEEARPT